MTTHALDLPGYLGHVGVPAEDLPPTLASLRRLHRAHVDAIPFANVGPALGRVPALDLPTLERRMVGEHRGGYCMEHATLFAAVLDELGFRTELRLCMVGDPAPGRPPTHLTVLVRVADDPRRWMSDVGFGVGILGPLPLPDGPGAGEPVRYGRWEHRVDVTDDGRILLVEHTAAGWRTLHTSADAEVDHDELHSANRWVALEEGSPFARRVVAMRTTEEQRERLRGTTLEVVGAGASTEVRELSPAEALDALQQRFGVAVDPSDRTGLEALLT